MGWNEVITSRDGASDSNDVRVYRRTFRVWDATPEQVLANPASITNALGQSLPEKGSTFEGLTCDSISASQNGTIVEYVANYSSDGRFQFPTVTRSEPPSGEWQYASSFQAVEVDLPVAVYRESVVAGELISSIVRQYDLETIKLRTQLRRHVISVTINSSDVQAAISAMDAQHDTLHRLTFDGTPRVYRFTSGDMRPSGRNKYVVDYAWEFDPGIPDRLPLQVQNAVIPAGLPFDTTAGISIPGSFTIPPYCRIFPEMPPPVTAPAFPALPVFRARCLIKANENGWQSLVGL